MKFPIFLIDNHYITKVYNLLFLLKHCSYNRNKKKRINQDNINFLYFFINNKNLLNENIEKIKKYEFDIQTIYTDKDLEIILKLLLIKELIEIEIIKTEVYYTLTKQGEDKLYELNQINYFSEDELKVLKKLSTYSINEFQELLRKIRW